MQDITPAKCLWWYYELTEQPETCKHEKTFSMGLTLTLLVSELYVDFFIAWRNASYPSAI